MVAGTPRDEEGPSRALLVALAIVYVGVGYAGVKFANLAGAVTLFWPPSGLGLAMSIRYGRLGLATCFGSALTLNLLLTSSLSFSSAAAFANAAEAGSATALFLSLARGRTNLARPSDAAALFVAGAIGASFAAAIGSVAVRVLLPSPDASVVGLYTTWWLGDMAGILVVAPPVLSCTSSFAVDPGRTRSRLATLVTVTLVLLSVIVAMLEFEHPPTGMPLALVPVGAVVFASFRFGTRGAHLSALVVSVACFLGTSFDRGPFFLGERDSSQWVLWAGVVLFGGTSLFVSSLVAERIAADLRVVESEKRLRALFDNAPDGMLLIDEQRRVVLANPAVIAMIGRSDLEGLRTTELLAAPESSGLRDALLQGIRRGERKVEARVTRSDADGTHEFVVRSAFLGERRRFEGAVVVVEDITEREKERRDHDEMEKQLASAQRLESIGNLAGGIAHDFNNMLQAIRANLELATLLAKRGKDPVGNVERALGATDRASALTRQLLAFSRRQPGRYDRVDVVRMLRSSLALLERLVPEDIHLVFDPRSSDAWVRGDHSQLEQVVLNLVVNARDAMPHGGALRIEVETERPDGSELGLVRITVADEGEGVDSSIRDRIFEPFFTTKPTGRGTGLGLAVVYGIVKSHGGSVHVENLPGKGAKFVVELPWLDSPQSVVDASEASGELPEGRGERILLVEDDPHVRSAVRDMLVASGYDVTVASNGADAVAVYRDADGDFDVVLLDVVMPVMGGREAYEQLRALDPDVSVVFATAYSEEQIDVGFVVRERVPVITKPYDRAALLAVLLQVLERKRLRVDEVISAG